MKIAVTTNKDGNGVFQHFGKSPAFKVYDIENGEVVNEELVELGGVQHQQLLGKLLGLGVAVLVCGGIGAGAVNMLRNKGIRVFAGNAGDTKAAALKAALGGQSETTEGTCNHHHDHADGHSCDHEHGEHHCDHK